MLLCKLSCPYIRLTLTIYITCDQDAVVGLPVVLTLHQAYPDAGCLYEETLLYIQLANHSAMQSLPSLGRQDMSQEGFEAEAVERVSALHARLTGTLLPGLASGGSGKQCAGFAAITQHAVASMSAWAAGRT